MYNAPIGSQEQQNSPTFGGLTSDDINKKKTSLLTFAISTSYRTQSGQHQLF